MSSTSREKTGWNRSAVSGLFLFDMMLEPIQYRAGNFTKPNSRVVNRLKFTKEPENGLFDSNLDII